MGLSNKTVILRFPSHAACRADATGDCLPQTFTEFQQKSCKKHSSYSYFHVAWQHSATRTLRFLSTSFYSLAHCPIWLFGYSLPTPRQVTSLTEIGFFLTEASITHTECLVHYLPQRSAPNVSSRSRGSFFLFEDNIAATHHGSSLKVSFQPFPSRSRSPEQGTQSLSTWVIM